MLRRRTGLVFACFAPQNRQKREGSRGFVHIFCGFACVFVFFREKSTHRRPEITKFPVPVARHENKKNSAMRPANKGRAVVGIEEPRIGEERAGCAIQLSHNVPFPRVRARTRLFFQEENTTSQRERKLACRVYAPELPIALWALVYVCIIFIQIKEQTRRLRALHVHHPKHPTLVAVVVMSSLVCNK